MYETTISKLEISTQFSNCHSLQDAIQKLETDFAKKGEVVCEITINGMKLSEKDEASLSEAEFSGVEEIKIKTSRPFDLVKEASHSAIQFMSRLNQASLQASEAFRQEDLDPAYPLFFSVADGMSSLIEMLVSIRQVILQSAIPPRMSSFNISTEVWAHAEESLLDTTQDLLDAFHKRDFILVADVLEYDVTKCLDSWTDLLRENANANREEPVADPGAT